MKKRCSRGRNLVPAYVPPAWALLGRPPFRAKCRATPAKVVHRLKDGDIQVPNSRASEPVIPGVKQGDCQTGGIAIDRLLDRCTVA
jgi:hypothetical protein